MIGPNKIDTLSKLIVNECSQLAGKDDIEFIKMSVVADKIMQLYGISMMNNFPELLRIMANTLELFEKEIGFKK
jgi:hypothetical protein